MSRGLEFNAQFQDADLQLDAFGSVTFDMPTRALFDIITNYNGDKQTLKIERLRKGNTAFRTGSVQPLLTAAENGYLYFDTTLEKPVWWTGTQWKDASGTVV
ncbi:hypothetical protein D9M71_688700 [compost metagenome]